MKTHSAGLSDTQSLPAGVFAPLAREMRLPAASLVAAADMLLADIGPDHASAGLVRLIRHESTRLYGAVTDLAALLLPLDLKTEWVDVSRLVRDLAERHRPTAGERGIVISAEPSEPDILAAADAAALDYVLDRLAAQALDDIETGGTLSITAHRAPEGGTHVIIGLHDTGPSLTEEEAEGLFEPSAPTGGRVPGIRLAACRRVVESMHGALTARPNESGGLSVELSLPEVQISR